MVCMGNICRSPTAEGVLRHQVREAGLQDQVEIDSAGTHDYHPGAPPDERSRHHASLRGYDLSALRARQVKQADFGRFDLILAMDWDNLAELQDECPAGHQHKLRRLMEFAGAVPSEVVVDPYYGGRDGFEAVLDHVEAACAGLVPHIREKLSGTGD
ncbi:MAG: low molecular weight phosphotyrosine protein phosphatase [Burkholderiales bacterium]|nr:low molecular weight phosphotyrosine protein phosphatase [Burkholderiales bacterium]